MKFKMYLKYLLTLFSALFFIFAGTGYNVAKYCCHHCEIQGLEHILNESCSHESQEIKSDCCDEMHFSEMTLNHHNLKHTDSCKLLRFTLDQFSVEDSDSHFTVQVIDLFGMQDFKSSHFLNETVSYVNIFETPPLFYPFCSGKNINIYKSVYLI